MTLDELSPKLTKKTLAIMTALREMRESVKALESQIRSIEYNLDHQYSLFYRGVLNERIVDFCRSIKREPGDYVPGATILFYVSPFEDKRINGKVPVIIGIQQLYIPLDCINDIELIIDLTPEDDKE